MIVTTSTVLHFAPNEHKRSSEHDPAKDSHFVHFRARPFVTSRSVKPNECPCKNSILAGGKRHAPGVTRTPDLRIRNPLLYPAELRAQMPGKVA